MITEVYKRRIQHLAGIRESKEIEGIDAKTKLSVFDFDGTLVDTPLPEDGKVIWKQKTGTNWEGGWFSEPNSLNMDVFDIKTIPGVISDYRRERSNKNNLVIMLTGRVPQLTSEVKAILNAHGLKFDDYLFNNGGETSQNKRNHMEMILRYNPNIRELELWDDRDEHIPAFKVWGDELVKKGYLDKFHINHIKSDRH